MSAIAGRLNLDGAPVVADYMSRLGAALARVGPDRVPTVHRLPAINILYRPFYTTEQETLASQPFVLDTTVATFDGRLDNREDLTTILVEKNRTFISDVEIATRAYLRWGVRFCEKLLGDYAVAIWDESRNRLVLARDPFGVKTLYFAKVDNSVVWCSTIDGLLSDPALGRDISDLFLASYLSLSPQPGISPFSSIQLLEPGSILVVQNGAFHSHEFWSIRDCIGTVRYDKDSEYEEHLLFVLKDAVSCRLRASGPIIAEMSGGLDSSCIACLAHAAMKEKSDLDDSFRTLSLIVPSWGNEEYFISEVENRLQCPHDRVHEDGSTVFSCDLDSEFIAYPTFLSFCPQRRRVLELASQNNARIILSGEFGDAVFRNDERFPVDLSARLWKTPVAHWMSELLKWSASEDTTVWALAWNAVIKPRLGKRCSLEPIPPWIAEQFASNSGLLEYSQELARPIAGIKDAYLSQYCQHLRASRTSLAGGLTYETTAHHVEARFPYIHLPLVSFLTSIPPDQIWRPDDRRSIMRRALRGILPEAVRCRKTKADLGGILTEGVENNWHWMKTLAETSILVDRGYVVQDKLIDAFTKVRCGMEVQTIMLLLRFIAAEIWLRNLDVVRSLATKTTELEHMPTKNSLQ
jgi:asparagine synthase (glutamine-hydrolysing)